MYPFSTRLQWVLNSRYRHLVAACRQATAADSLVQERVDALVRWGKLRAFVAFFLYLGLLSSIGSFLAQYLPGFEEASSPLQDAAAITGAFTGALTLAFLALTRLLGQLEIDILTLFVLERTSNGSTATSRKKKVMRDEIADDV